MRSKSAFIFAAYFLSVLIVSGNLVADSFQEHMKAASEFMSKSEFESAIPEYQKALQRKRKSIDAQSWLEIAYERMGDRLYNNGETDRAIDAYTNALAFGPNEPYLHEHLGLALEKKGDREAATREYRTAAELLPLDDGLQGKYQQFIGGLVGAGSDDRLNKTGEPIERVGGNVSPPIPIVKPEPPYSERARLARLQGTLTLWAVIDRNGNVVGTTITQRLGMGLDANALKTVRTWKFEPAKRNGTPVPVRAMIRISFRLF